MTEPVRERPDRRGEQRGRVREQKRAKTNKERQRIKEAMTKK